MKENSFPENIKLIIWDVDGVFYPYDKDFKKATATAGAAVAKDKQLLRPATTAKVVREALKTREELGTLRALANAASEESDTPLPKFLEDVHERHGTGFIKPMPGLKKAFDACSDKVVHAALTLSDEDWTADVLKSHTIYDKFKTIFCIPAGAKKKSESPQAYEQLLSEINAGRSKEDQIKPEHVLVVDDSAQNLGQAKEAGMQTAWVPHSKFHKHAKEDLPGGVNYIFETPRDVLSSISRISAQEEHATHRANLLTRAAAALLSR